MNTIDVIKGNSFSFSVSVPIDKVSQINEIVVSIADVVVAKKSDNTLNLADGFTNKYIVELSSQYTQSQRGSCLVTVAIDFDDLGVRKSSANDGLMLRFIESQNGFNNEATSEVIDAALVFFIDVDTITTQVELATVMRGYSAYEIAVQNGYSGTESEWNASVNSNRLAAEAAATTATTQAGISTTKAGEVYA